MLWIVFKYLTKAYTTISSVWTQFWSWWEEDSTLKPYRQFFLNKHHLAFEPSYTEVPAETIYVEEWKWLGESLLRIRYPGEHIPRAWFHNPFEQRVKQPWIYVGDKTTELDLTRTFNRFLVVGNIIRQELIDHLITDEDSELIYIAPRTFEQLKFPGEGIRIEHDDSL